MRKLPVNQRNPDSIMSHIRDRIVSGELIAGAKIHEVDFSSTLGVSRTPMREALRGLEAEGLIRYERNRGFWVAPLDAREVRDVYPILWSLEVLALRDSALLVPSSLEELREENERFLSRAKRPSKAAESDEAFHQLLIGNSPNRTLLDMIVGLKRRARRYEAIYLGEESLVKVSYEHHARIIDAIQEGAIARAIKALEDNWRFGMDALLRGL